MKILTIIISIIILAILCFLLYCIMLLNEYITKNGLRYHWYDDEEGDD